MNDFDPLQEATDFIKKNVLLKESFDKFIIKIDSVEINLAQLMQDYAEWYQEEHDQGVYGDPNY